MTINDSHIDPQMTFKKLVFLNMQQLTNFPYIEKDFDALTDYQLLCKVVEYLNMVIENSNDQNDSITNLYNAFISLQTYVNTNFDDLETAFNNLQTFVNNYFDNLDVQEEINNKLDDMLESGQLEQIIEQFLQTTALWCFNTVAEMQQATNLVNGSYVRTLGYYSLNDGGGATYIITNTESESYYQEELSDNLYANLLVFSTINVKQVGAYGDNEHDDTDKINYCLSKFAWKNVYFPKGSYKIESTVNISEGKNIYGDGMFLSTLRYYGSTKAVEIVNNYYGITNIKNLSIIKNGNYTEGDTTSIGFNVSKGTSNRNVTNLYMENVVIRYFGKNFNSSTAGALLNSNFTNCLFEGGYNNCYIVGGFNNYFDKCRFGEAVHWGYFQQSGEGKFNDCSFESNHIGVRLANSGGGYSFINCFFENTDTTETSNHSLISIEAGSLASIDNINIIGCHFYGGYRQVYLDRVKRVTFINNTMFNPGLLCVGYNYTNQYIESIVYINNNFAVKPYDKSTFVSFIEDNEQDTGWVTIDTTSVNIGTFHNLKIRRIGKIVYWSGFLDNITDSDINQSLGLTLPSNFIPDYPASIIMSCPMSQGNLGDFSKNACLRIGDNYIRVLGYSATSNVLNQIDLSNIVYIGK